MDDAKPAAKAKSDLPKPVKLGFSHIGLHCVDLPRMVDFYTRVLGFTETDRGVARGFDIVFTSWDASDHHQMVLAAGRPGLAGFNHINQISFRVPRFEDIQAVWRRVKDEPGVHDIRGTNHGNAFSMYFRDPEGNRIELFMDTPWYVDQPMRVPLDMSLSDEALWKWAEQHARSLPGFVPMEEWRDRVAKKMKSH
mgnify:CR=1 FL=1